MSTILFDFLVLSYVDSPKPVTEMDTVNPFNFVSIKFRVFVLSGISRFYVKALYNL